MPRTSTGEYQPTPICWQLIRSDHSAPGANSGNPYAAAAAPSNNPYASAQPSYPPAPQQQTYATPTSYGQQDKYSAGGQAGHANGGGSFWNQLDETNALLKELQSKIGQVREAHQSTLVSYYWPWE